MCWLVALLFGVLPTTLYANDQSSGPNAQNQKLENGFIVVGAATDSFPYSFIDATGESRGFSADVIDATARAVNLRIKRTALPNREIQANFIRGEYDALECYGQSAAREATCDFSVPYTNFEGAIFVRSNDKTVKTVADLRGRIFALQGVRSIGEDFLNTTGLDCQRVYSSSSLASFLLMEAGKADASIGARLTALSVIDRLRLNHIKELNVPVVGFDIRHCFAVHKGNAALLARLNEGLAIIHRTGEYERIYRRWFGRFERSVFTREQVYSYAAIAFLLAFVGASWALYKQRALDKHIAHQADVLRVINGDLQKATLAKTDFIRTVSHELRNPLAGARMMAEVLKHSSLDPKSKDQIDKLHGCVSYLAAVLDETLDLAQIELGHTPTKLTQFKLDTLLTETMSIFESVAAEKALNYRCETGTLHDTHFQGAAMHLKRILINYLSNAFKFTTSGSVTIWVTQIAAVAHTTTLRFTVVDTGPGIPLALQPKIFSTYVRAGEPQLDGSARGAGLGLAVCQKLAELNGGRVGFGSEIGKGTRFWVELPLIAVTATEDTTVPFERPDFSAVRTLVVDDEKLQRETMSILLQEMGVVPQLAGTIEQATTALASKTFDLVLADYNLGTSNGIELLKTALRQSRPGKPLPVFHLVTSCDIKSLHGYALRTGFTGVHHKPLNFSEIYEILASIDTARSPTSTLVNRSS